MLTSFCYPHLGNSQGNVILFEPSTSEHISARTIFDPITALAPAFDCQTYAIGSVNMKSYTRFMKFC